MGIIPGEASEADRLKLEEEAKTRKPRVGDAAYINIRGKIVSMSNAMAQIELSELHEAGVILDPIFMWIPSQAISFNQLADQPRA